MNSFILNGETVFDSDSPETHCGRRAGKELRAAESNEKNGSAVDV